MVDTNNEKNECTGRRRNGMPDRLASGLLDQLRYAVARRDPAETTDGQLLERFVSARDEAAFDALVRRHGPMVFGLCRRLLGTVHDAEDAFQATFLVLVRKAASVTPRELVGNWLYGVAYRTAMEVRALAARRRRKESRAPARVTTEIETSGEGLDWLPLLDREVHQLPDKYRVPVVLCHLEGRSRREVAARLGIPEGTLSSRLATARARLARRLARYGPLLGVGTLTAALAPQAAGTVPHSLRIATVRAAATLAFGHGAAASPQVANITEKVLKAMLWTKLRCGVSAALTSVVLAFGALVAPAWIADAAGIGARSGESPVESAVSVPTGDQWGAGPGGRGTRSAAPAADSGVQIPRPLISGQGSSAGRNEPPPNTEASPEPRAHPRFDHPHGVHDHPHSRYASSLSPENSTDTRAVSGQTGGATPKGGLRVNQVVPDFQVSDLDGNAVRLADLRQSSPRGEASVVVLSFWCSFCGSCRAVEGPLDALRKRYEGRARILALDASAGETAEKVRAFAARKGLGLRVLLDPSGQTADLFGVRVTTTTAVIDSAGRLRYLGRFADQEHVYAENALRAVLDGRDVAVKSTPPQGCPIRRELK
jgi:RNA polymerase sigma factor (sigma-70 family)